MQLERKRDKKKREAIETVLLFFLLFELYPQILKNSKKMGCIKSKSARKKENKKSNGDNTPSNKLTTSINEQAKSTGTLVPKNKQFIREALESHNQIRAVHQANKLKVNNELNKLAQIWAEHIANSNKFEHSNHSYLGQSLGENIAMRYTSTGDELTGRQMTEQWYEEALNYNYNEDFQQGKGHFAQIVWRTTCEVGFGRAKAPDGKWYAVANYYPAGNYISQFRENVSPPIDVDRV